MDYVRSSRIGGNASIR